MKNRKRATGPLSAALSRLYRHSDPFQTVRSFAIDLLANVQQQEPPFCPFHCAEALDIRVEWQSIGAEGVLAGWPNGNCYVVLMNREVQNRTVARRERFTLAHELGHYIIRRSLRGFFPASMLQEGSNEEERFCNAFAAELLMPSARFMQDLRITDLRASRLLELTDTYHVSLQAVACRAATLLNGVMVAIWSSVGNELRPQWAYPMRLKDMRLCDTGRTSVELAIATGKENKGRDEFFVTKSRTRWHCSSIPVPGTGKILTLGSRSRVSPRFAVLAMPKRSFVAKAMPPHQLALPLGGEPTLLAARER